ncbi:MAG: sensory transduction histidine kinase [Gemmatimonadetes bacterium]|nr:sensory transduction histidine kinase [Gemmatimonadota bacterium]
MSAQTRPTGISVVGDVPWGMHFSLFYDSAQDLLDAVVPYFAAGLNAGELCVWVPSEPSVERLAAEALRELVPDFDQRMERRDIEFFQPDDFYRQNGRFDRDAVMAKWRQWGARLQHDGHPGLRVSGNLTWLTRLDWPLFGEYEQALNDFLSARRMLVLCTYRLAGAAAADMLDVARAHHFVIARRRGEWEVLEREALAQSKDELHRLNEQLEARVAERTSQLRRSEAYLAQGERLSHTGSYAWNATTGECVFWTDESFRIIGLEPRAAAPTRQELFALIHPDDRQRVAQTVELMLRERRTSELEFQIVRPNGEVRDVQAVTTPVLDAQGQLVELVGSAIDVTDRKRAAARLARVKRLARERLLEARFTAVLDERTRLAREIHDSLLQGVAGIALQLRAALPNLGPTPPAAAESIRQIAELAESTIRDARRAVWDIRAPALVQHGLLAALDAELRRAAAGVALQLTVEGTPRALAPAIEDAIFRIAQEAAINAAKHSGASGVSVVLAFRPRSVRLTVSDDGRGFRADGRVRAHGGRWGILGMHERADRIGGTLAIRSAPGAGTTVELRVLSNRKPSSDDLTVPRRLRHTS